MSHKNFTSETIRLEPSSSSSNVSHDSDRTLLLQAGVVTNTQNYQKKKVSSFQITSIRPTSSHSSNDGGEDSENDTEDTSDILDISKITTDLDQETPSFSEDYSKSEDMLLGPTPVIPTSSQFGITTLVQQAGSGGMMTARLPQGVTVNVTEGGLALAKAVGESDGLDNWQNRFRIVKINSNEPVKRGRWVCLDFMDTPAVNASESKAGEIPSLVVSNVVIPEGDASIPPTHGVQIPITGPETQFYLHTTSSQYFTPVSLSQTGIVTSHIPTANSTQMAQAVPGLVPSGSQYPHPSSQQIHNIVQGYSMQPPQGAALPSVLTSQPMPVSASQPIVFSEADIQASPRMSSNTNIPQPGLQMGMQPGIVTQSHPHPVVSQSEKPHQPVIMNVTQNVIGTHISSQGMQAPPIVSNQSHTQQVSVSMAQTGIVQNVTSQSGAQTISSTQQLQSSSSVTISPAPNYSSHPNTGVTPTPATTPAQSTGILNVGASQAAPPSDPHLQSLVQLSSVTGTSHQPTSVQSHPNTLEGLPLVGQSQDPSAPTTATPPTGIGQTEDTESASTASTVAIDNKIEQAMDLVKSHLMFAVREEVEVLKEKIVDLLDRIHNLECENTLLRQYAPQEALQQIQQQLQQQLPPAQQQLPQAQQQQQQQQQPTHHISS